MVVPWRLSTVRSIDRPMGGGRASERATERQGRGEGGRGGETFPTAPAYFSLENYFDCLLLIDTKYLGGWVGGYCLE